MRSSPESVGLQRLPDVDGRRRARLGHVTLHEGRSGRWCGASIGLDHSQTELLRGQISARDYALELRQRNADLRRALALVGKPARSAPGRLWRALGRD
jgi:hypothetical protein